MTSVGHMCSSSVGETHISAQETLKLRNLCLHSRTPRVQWLLSPSDCRSRGGSSFDRPSNCWSSMLRPDGKVAGFTSEPLVGYDLHKLSAAASRVGVPREEVLSSASWRWQNSCFDSSKRTKPEQAVVSVEKGEIWDWERWREHFVQVEEQERRESNPKFELENALSEERFMEAPWSKKGPEEEAANGPVTEVVWENKSYETATSLRDAAGLVSKDMEEHLRMAVTPSQRQRGSSKCNSSQRIKSMGSNTDPITDEKEKSKSKRRSKQKEVTTEKKEEEEEELYDWPRLVCCFGEAMNEFVPTVRVSNKRQDPDKYSTWKMLQWMPPEFARILGGPSFNTAIALARQGCRVALMGKVGDDEYGQQLVYTLNVNRVQTRGVRFDAREKTGISELSVSFKNGEATMSCVKPSAENSLLESEINPDILKEATMFHFTSSTLTAEPIRSSLFSALKMYKVSGGDVFYDVNLSLPLWISREDTWRVIEDAWLEANFIEVTKHELEFLLGQKNINKKAPQYAISDDEPRPLRDEYHYTPAEVAPLWHKNLKMLFVTDGTYVIHYYALDFNGKVLGVEDVIVAAYTCDRAGSADAIVAGIIRKLNLQPELYKDKETMPKALRYAMSAGVIAQWTPGSTKGLPTESAAQNLTEQIYHPVFVQSIGTELYSTVKRDYLL